MFFNFLSISAYKNSAGKENMNSKKYLQTWPRRRNLWVLRKIYVVVQTKITSKNKSLIQVQIISVTQKSPPVPTIQ